MIMPQYREYLLEFHWLKHLIKNHSTELESITEEQTNRYENILKIIPNIIEKYMESKMGREFSDEEYVLYRFFYLKPPYTTVNTPHMLYYPRVFLDRYLYYLLPVDVEHDYFTVHLVECYECMVHTINNEEEDIDETAVEEHPNENTDNTDNQ
jgi:hypothetical protein